jgi:hypothetical protein
LVNSKVGRQLGMSGKTSLWYYHIYGSRILSRQEALNLMILKFQHTNKNIRDV